MEDKSIKYYIEIADMDSPCEYIMQSKLFNTEEKAINFAKQITFLDKQYSISLMKYIIDGDIFFVRYLDKELKL